MTRHADSSDSRLVRTPRRSRLRPEWVAAAAVATVFASGCASSDDTTQARAVTERFVAAAAKHDGRGACAQLSPPLRKQLVFDESEPTCAKAVTKLSLRPSRVTAVRVYAISALAALDDGNTVFLGKTKLGWRIDAVGCKPRGSGPYDCKEQA